MSLDSVIIQTTIILISVTVKSSDPATVVLICLNSENAHMKSVLVYLINGSPSLMYS